MPLIPKNEAPEVEPELKQFNCKICKSPDRPKVDAALYEGSMSQSEVARLLGVNNKTVFNHVKNHLSLVFIHTGRGKKTTLVEALNDVELRTLQVLSDALKKKNNELALRAIARREAQIKLLAELTGELRERRPSEMAEQRKAEQFEQAVSNLLDEAAKKGLALTPAEAIMGLLKNAPEFGPYIKMTKWHAVELPKSVQETLQ